MFVFVFVNGLREIGLWIGNGQGSADLGVLQQRTVRNKGVR